MILFLTLFGAGVLTILLPCILPLVPIVVGVSITDRNPWRPLATVAGMVVSFVGFSFLLLVILRNFVWMTEYIRFGTYDLLLLFGIGFITHNRSAQVVTAILGGFFFWGMGWLTIAVAIALNLLAILSAGTIASSIQQFGAGVQGKARTNFSGHPVLTAFLMGLTLGFVWVPCAGPALAFAYTVVREEPGIRAAALLMSYGLGTAMPLLLIGYGGQRIVHSMRQVSRYSERIKQISGSLLIFSALALRLGWFQSLQTYLIASPVGDIGPQIEEYFFGSQFEDGQL